MIVIHPDQYRHMPWKNGGGSTVEIAISPAGASLDDFDWRVSMAGVAEPGPFSNFAGVDRTLSVLSGNGIVLDIEGKPVTLVQTSPPLSFAADIKVHGKPIDGPITDLNVMTRRGRNRHAVRHVTAGQEATVSCAGPTNLILAAADFRVGADLVVSAGATIRLDGPAEGLDLTGDTVLDLYLIELFAL